MFQPKEHLKKGYPPRHFMQFKSNLFNWWLTRTIVLDYDILWDHCCMWNKCVLRHLWYIQKVKDNYSINKKKIKDFMRCLVPPKKSPNIFNQRRRVYLYIQIRDIMLHTFDCLILIWLMTYAKKSFIMHWHFVGSLLHVNKRRK